MFKVEVAFSAQAPAGTARLRVYVGKRRVAEGSFAVRQGRSVTKTLRLNRTGRRKIRAGRSRRVTVELRLPDGRKVRETVRLARRKR